MTDKQIPNERRQYEYKSVYPEKSIIINGVDVSGCEAYKRRHCLDKTSIMFCKTNLCSNFPNCYYKQLKRKEQECERPKTLKDETYFRLKDEYIQQLDQLKAENDTYKKMLEDEDVQLALTEIRSGERHLWRNKAEKLSKALAEIKEIAEDIEDLFYEGLETGTTYDRVITLLNKISEVQE